MIQIPYDAFLWTCTLIAILIMCVMAVVLARKKPFTNWILLSIGAGIILFIPLWIAMCFIICPFYTHEGTVKDASQWDKELSEHRYHWADVPANSTDIEYFKNTVGEHFGCVVDENDFLDWCESNKMSKQEKQAIPDQNGLEYAFSSIPKIFVSGFLKRGVRMDDDYLPFASEAMPNGRRMKAIFFPRTHLMIYHENYW